MIFAPLPDNRSSLLFCLSYWLTCSLLSLACFGCCSLALFFLLIFLPATYLIQSGVHDTSLDLPSLVRLVLAPFHQPSYKSKIQHTGGRMGLINPHRTAKRMRPLFTYLYPSSVILRAAGCLRYGLNLRHDRHSERQTGEQTDWV